MQLELGKDITQRGFMVKEASDNGIAGIDITSVTNKFMKENPDMVRTFLEITHEANDRYKAGKSDFNVISKDATMDVASTKDQMASFGFPSVDQQMNGHTWF